MISSKAILEVFLTDGSSAAQLWSVTLRIYIHRWLCTRARCLCPRRWPCSPSSVRSSTAVAAYSFLALYWLTTVACVVVGSPVSVVAGAFSSFNARLATKSFSSQLQLLQQQLLTSKQRPQLRVLRSHCRHARQRAKAFDDLH